MWSFFLARKQLFPPGKFPVFAFVSILGVALGVTALLVVQTVMNSFGEEHRRRVRESNGDVLVFTESGSTFPVTGTGNFLEALRKFPEVRAAAPYVEDGVVVLGNGKFDLNFLRGIDPAHEDDVVPVRKYLLYGDWDDFDDFTFTFYISSTG